MEVGIGLPSAVRGAQADQILEWARRADAAGFSSLGTIDRLVFPGYEPLVTLAAAAAVTERIRLATAIVIAPIRGSAGALAKQAASVDALSGGRLVLGLAVGGREDDFDAAGVPFKERGKRMDEMLEEMKDVWSNEETRPGGTPKVIIGGSVDAAYRRAAEHGQGWIMGGGTPEMLAEGKAKTEEAWKAAGRDGSPRIMALAYYALGDGAEETATNALKDYYGWLGEYADQIAASAATDPDTVKSYLAGFEEAGCDELIIFPTSPDPSRWTAWPRWRSRSVRAVAHHGRVASPKDLVRIAEHTVTAALGIRLARSLYGRWRVMQAEERERLAQIADRVKESALDLRGVGRPRGRRARPARGQRAAGRGDDRVGRGRPRGRRDRGHAACART